MNNVRRFSPQNMLPLLLIMGVSMSACSESLSWREEVLLHDGSKMLVTRTQIRAGAGEIGQGPPITEHSIVFTPTGSTGPITWKSELAKDLGHANFDLLALDVVGGTPYIAASPTLCSGYNKWGRPNPPYVFFKYTGEQWRRIPLQELPTEIVRPNVVINIYRTADIENDKKTSDFVSIARINEINASLKQEEYKSIVRRPITRASQSTSLVNCPDYSSSQYTSPKAPPAPVPKEAGDKK